MVMFCLCWDKESLSGDLSTDLVNHRGQVGAPIFNPSTWEEDTGNDVVGQRQKVIS